MLQITRRGDEGDGAGASGLEQLLERITLLIELVSVARDKALSRREVVAIPFAKLIAERERQGEPSSGKLVVFTPRGQSRSTSKRRPSCGEAGS